MATFAELVSASGLSPFSTIVWGQLPESDWKSSVKYCSPVAWGAASVGAATGAWVGGASVGGACGGTSEGGWGGTAVGAVVWMVTGMQASMAIRSTPTIMSGRNGADRFIVPSPKDKEEFARLVWPRRPLPGQTRRANYILIKQKMHGFAMHFQGVDGGNRTRVRKNRPSELYERSL